MSGGSLNYIYNQVEDAAMKIAGHFGNPDHYVAKGVAFSKLLLQVSKALKDIEWDMSGDGSDWKEVDKLIGPKEEADAVATGLKSLLEHANEILNMLDARQNNR